MRRSGSKFLGEHRSDKLRIAINIQSPLDPNEDVICRTEIDAAAPNDAAAFSLDHFLHGRHIERYRRHGLHRIRSAGR